MTSNKMAKVVKKEVTGGKKFFASYVLALIGSIIAIIASLISITVWQGWYGLFCGVVMLMSATMIRTKAKFAGIILLIFGIAALIVPPYGFVAGPLLGMIAGIVGLVKS